MSKGICRLYSGTKGESSGGNNGAVGISSENTESSDDILNPKVSYAKDGTKLVNGFPAKVQEGKQGKHIPGHKNYQPGKSTLSITVSEADELIKEKGGTGKLVAPNSNKERVDFGIQIGTYKNPKTGEALPTTKGIIHYSKTGAHIVPSNPNSEEE